MRELALLVATRKGAWIYRSDVERREWRADGPHFLGHIIHHLVLDPRDGRTLLAAAKTGHLGPTIFRSTDMGRSWSEASRPPAFPKAGEGEVGRAVDHSFWLTPGHASEPGLWYAGTSPQALFRSEDGGATWEGVAGFNDNPAYRDRLGGAQDGTPDGPKLHSMLVDPRDAAHLYLGMSGGGVHESQDAGQTWVPLIDGLEVVEGFDASQWAFHDPHCLTLCPSNPDRLYQQNHCGIYRIDRPSNQWRRIGRAMPTEVGDIGFPIIVHPRDDQTCWVFPMDGTDVWPRTSPGGKPAVYITRDGGESWSRQDVGLPQNSAWWTVYRQAMANDICDPVGVYVGTASGGLWMSADEGEQWSMIAQHLPPIFAVETAVLA
ncbi:glycosyl hydrolase [Sphingobium sp. EM0848]|uniref:WD40/YVTN/BNR-like repeat-containing protein n=1 Tax=Sphingobium sp. EM0848 TaxID=2743473 RepID=UPI00159BF252|nr:glycosyl hydrolase [Sphingobium sp. EM0848]